MPLLAAGVRVFMTKHINYEAFFPKFARTVAWVDGTYEIREYTDLSRSEFDGMGIDDARSAEMSPAERVDTLKRHIQMMLGLRLRDCQSGELLTAVAGQGEHTFRIANGSPDDEVLHAGDIVHLIAFGKMLHGEVESVTEGGVVRVKDAWRTSIANATIFRAVRREHLDDLEQMSLAGAEALHDLILFIRNPDAYEAKQRGEEWTADPTAAVESSTSPTTSSPSATPTKA